MKNQALFSSKDKSKNLKYCLMLFLFGTLRANLVISAMHRTFQRDLYLLRLRTAREYLKALNSSMNPISSDPNEPLKLSAQVSQ